MGKASCSFSAVYGLFGPGRPGCGFTTGCDPKAQTGLTPKGNDRGKRFELQQLTRGGAVRADHHLMAMRHGGAVQDTRRRQGCGIGPDRMVIG